MTKSAELTAQLLSQRVETIAKLADTDSAKLNRKNQDGRSMRAVMRVMNDHELSHLIQVQKVRQAIGSFPTEVQMILAQTLQARAALAASIVGLSDEDLDRKPADSEWSVREIVEHVLRYDPVLIERLTTQFEGGQ
jgi:hypothetical protein